MHYVTPDLCDAYPDVAVVEPMFSNFGGHDSFGGEIVTVKCFEDNSVVKEQVELDGRGKVMAQTPLGIQALASHPMKTDKRGIGDLNVAVTFAGVTFKPGEFVYADNNGIIVSAQALDMPA